MGTKKILFPTDFSHASDAALEMASSLARDSDAKLVIAHVEEPPPAYGSGKLYYGLPDPAYEELKKMLDDVVPADPQVGYEHRLATGDPASAIVELAEHEHVDMIVMGTHGRTGVSRMLMGSVAEAVVRRAALPGADL